VDRCVNGGSPDSIDRVLSNTADNVALYPTHKRKDKNVAEIMRRMRTIASGVALAARRIRALASGSVPSSAGVKRRRDL
jgi:peptide deformylase